VFILVSFGFSVGVIIAGIGGVGMRRAMGHLGGVEIGPMFFSHLASSSTSFSVDRKSFHSSLSG